MLRPVSLTLTALLLQAFACSPDDASPDEPPVSAVNFDTTRVRLASQGDTVTLRVELAVSQDQKTVGLMERRALADDAGMLFLYDSEQPANAGFWMFRTRIPLDIAFLDSAGVIRAIRAMEPCASPFAGSCPTYDAGVPYRAALEMNRGFFERRGVRLGDRVLLEDLSR
jgi:uncharacterized protein